MTDNVYEILTWDPETEEWTHQEGLPPNPIIGKEAFEEALQELVKMGYGSLSPCVSVSINGEEVEDYLL